MAFLCSRFVLGKNICASDTFVRPSASRNEVPSSNCTLMTHGNTTLAWNRNFDVFRNNLGADTLPKNAHLRVSKKNLFGPQLIAVITFWGWNAINLINRSVLLIALRCYAEFRFEFFLKRLWASDDSAGTSSRPERSSSPSTKLL